MTTTASRRGLPEVASRRGIPEVLTAAPEQRLPVPNHLLDSETFSKVAKNDVVVASPSVIHFGGFEVGRLHTHRLDLVNCSSEVQRYHIIAPQTKYFKIKYTKGDRLIPGLALHVDVSFEASEWRYHYDCIRVHCRGSDNLVIPIHAYPTLDHAGVPKNYTFPPTPIGIQQTKVVPLRSPHPVSFEFRVSILEGNPAFAVQPMEGMVPPNGEARINVIFTPIAFVTATMRMLIETSQFNSKPLICVFGGTCRPGMITQVDGSRSGQRHATDPPSTLDPTEIKPLDVARKRKQLLKLTKVSFHGRRPPGSAGDSESSASELEKDGLMFPKDLNNPQAISYVLNQRPGRMTAKQLRDVISQASTRKKSAKASRARKEALFVTKTNDLQAEERANQLRWITKLGEEAMSPRSKEEVTEDRTTALEIYKQKRGDPTVDDEVGRSNSVAKYKRIERGVDRPESPSRRPSKASAVDGDEPSPEFDHYKNDPWMLKNRALFLFNQAARKVLIQNRADHNLAKMRRFKEAWKAGRWSVENLSVTSAPDEMSTPPITAGGLEAAMGEGFLNSNRSDKEDVVITDLEDEEKATEIITKRIDKLAPSVFNAEVIRTSTFPEYIPPDFVDDMSGEALGFVPYRISEVQVHSQTPYFDLKVPQQCRILTYSRHGTQEAASSYVSPQRRLLRTGASEEIVKPLRPINDENEPDATSRPDAAPVMPEEVVRMPTFLDNFKFPPIEVFNPAPGLVRYRKPLPYAETDLDFHLNPIPPHPARQDISTSTPHCTTQKAFLDPDDVIPGVMTWKKCSKHGLAATIQIPSISSVWVPRWSDPFVEDMVPRRGPTMMSPPDSEEEETKEAKVSPKASQELTFEGVKAQHHLIPETVIPPAPSTHFDSILHLNSGASAPVDASQNAAQLDAGDSGANFPYCRSLPKSNIPLAPNGGLISRDQRMRELNMFVLSKYNQLGRRVNENQEAMNALLTDQSLKLVKKGPKVQEEAGDTEEVFKPSCGKETPVIVTSATSRPSES